MARNSRRLTSVCRQTQSSFAACVQMAVVSLVRLTTRRKPRWSADGQKIAVQVYQAQPSQHVPGSLGLFTAVLPNACTPFSDRDAWLTALHRAGLWEGRKGAVVVLGYDWCDPEETSADGGCRFIVLPTCGLKQALSSSSWDQGPVSKLQRDLYDSAARQRDTFLTREHPICVHICHQVWSDAVLNSQRYSGNFTSFLKTKDTGRAITHAVPLWAWERVGDDGPGTKDQSTHQSLNCKITSRVVGLYFFSSFFLWRESFFSPFPPITLLRSVSFVYLLHFTKYHLKGHVGSMSTTCINICLTESLRD